MAEGTTASTAGSTAGGDRGRAPAVTRARHRHHARPEQHHRRRSPGRQCHRQRGSATDRLGSPDRNRRKPLGLGSPVVSGLPTVGPGLPTVGCGLSALGWGLSALGWGLPAVGCKLSTLGCGLSMLGHGAQANPTPPPSSSERPNAYALVRMGPGAAALVRLPSVRLPQCF
jgi:hypothetical protein